MFPKTYMATTHDFKYVDSIMRPDNNSFIKIWDIEEMAGSNFVKINSISWMDLQKLYKLTGMAS